MYFTAYLSSLVLLAHCHAQSQEIDVVSYEEVTTGFPFDVHKVNLSVEPDGAFVVELHYTSQVHLETHWLYSYLDYVPFTDVSGDEPPVTNCVRATNFSCSSTLRIKDPARYGKLSALLFLRNDEGAFTYKLNTDYNSGMSGGWIPYTSGDYAPIFRAHPPAKVDFDLGEAVSLYWEFEQSDRWLPPIEQLKFTDGVRSRFKIADDYYVEDDIITYTVDNMDVRIVTTILESGQINFRVSIMIRSASSNNAGIVRIYAKHYKYRMDVELVERRRWSAYPYPIQEIDFHSCGSRGPTLFTPEMELCLECSSMGLYNIRLKILRDGVELLSVEDSVLSRSSVFPEEQKAHWIVPSPSESEDSGVYQCRSTNNFGMVYANLPVRVRAEEPRVTNFEITDRDDEKIIFECDAVDIEGLNSELVFEWFRDEVEAYPTSGWMEEMYVTQDTSDGPVWMNVQHEQGSLNWHAQITLDLTQISFGPELADFFTCLLRSDYFTAMKGVNDVNDRAEVEAL